MTPISITVSGPRAKVLSRLEENRALAPGDTLRNDIIDRLVAEVTSAAEGSDNFAINVYFSMSYFLPGPAGPREVGI